MTIKKLEEIQKVGRELEEARRDVRKLADSERINQIGLGKLGKHNGAIYIQNKIVGKRLRDAMLSVSKDILEMLEYKFEKL